MIDDNILLQIVNDELRLKLILTQREFKAWEKSKPMTKWLFYRILDKICARGYAKLFFMTLDRFPEYTDIYLEDIERYTKKCVKKARIEQKKIKKLHDWFYNELLPKYEENTQ